MAAICPTPSRKRQHQYGIDEYPSSKRFHHQQQFRGLSSTTEQILTSLRCLFPGMDDDTLKCVLDSCANDVDAAIERLTSLRIESSSCDDRRETERAVSSKCSSSRPEDVDERRLSSPAASPVVDPKTPEEWIEAFVGEMSRSRDVADARARAARALAAFEKFVDQRASDKLQRLEKENSLLKRAVTIQNQRLAEARECAHQSANDVHKLNDKLKQAEMSNYSLSVHLRQLNGVIDFNGGLQHGHHPDVF